jgi:hypothetical protein
MRPHTKWDIHVLRPEKSCQKNSIQQKSVEKAKVVDGKLN